MLIAVVLKDRVSWDFFQTEFRKKYFLELKQGHRIVVEYEREFVRLSKYAQECILSEAVMCTRFKEGLNEGIQLLVEILELKEFVVLIDQTHKAEEFAKQIKRQSLKSETRKMNESHSRMSAPSRLLSKDRGKQASRLPKNSGNARVTRSGTKDIAVRFEAQAPTRAFTIRAREDVSTPDVIVGTFSLFDVTIYADPRSTHSYICTALVMDKKIPIE
ncbi:Hexaprenyldihydroxybenzoate methyltransferase, mitochondrial-like protein [Gossypium australe]|uniref:Hexaprenyldihydroxybenzoate methyltransferase, mitochondrial-like protein n=1 Tax=Gossypium australe TaxID=47621 RepID=A0A5B6VVA7_9ROSI|nr:Hexaprenyldihydroxybenzoate methyltransferase, mitochondrial-like protein [Gossypium australe]